MTCCTLRAAEGAQRTADAREPQFTLRDADRLAHYLESSKYSTWSLEVGHHKIEAYGVWYAN